MITRYIGTNKIYRLFQTGTPDRRFRRVFGVILRGAWFAWIPTPEHIRSGDANNPGPDELMLGLYLFSLVLGGGLLVLSLLGGEGDADAPDADFQAHSDVDVHVDADAGAGHSHFGAGGLVLGLFKPRNLVFLLATFGITGSLLTWLGLGRATTLGLAIGMGAAAMVLTHAVFTWIRRSDAAVEVLSDADLEGSIARVVLPLAPGVAGQIACIAGGREVYLTARLAADVSESLATGSEVVILRTGDGIAEVIPSGMLEPPSDSQSRLS
jgi:hypothetical protein